MMLCKTLSSIPINSVEENAMSRSELVGELGVLRVQLGHAKEENELLYKKIRLSDETAGRCAKKYAEFTT